VHSLPPIEADKSTLESLQFIIPLFEPESPLITTAREILDALLKDHTLSTGAMDLCRGHEWCNDLFTSVHFHYPPLFLAWMRYWLAYPTPSAVPKYMTWSQSNFPTLYEMVENLSLEVLLDGDDENLISFKEIAVDGQPTMAYRYGDELGWFSQDRFMVADISEFVPTMDRFREVEYSVETEGRVFHFEVEVRKMLLM